MRTPIGPRQALVSLCAIALTLPTIFTRQTGLSHVDGTLSVGRITPGTGSAGAFFICIGKQPELDFGGHRNPDGQGFAAFGRVTSGMELVRTIWNRPTKGVDGSIAAQMIETPVEILAIERR